MPSLHQKQRVRNKTFPLVYCNIKNPWASRCFRCSSSWPDIKIKTQPISLIINKLKIMQNIFTFSLRRFHNKQVYGCDQTAKSFFSYCEVYFIVKPILALNQVINILRARQIQKLIPNGDSTIIICKILSLLIIKATGCVLILKSHEEEHLKHVEAHGFLILE